MITVHTCIADKRATITDLSASTLPDNVVWIDLLNGDPLEVAFIERATALHVPTLKELSEIESSSRLRIQNDALYVSAPMIFRTDFGESITTSVGFVLRHDLLITIRFADLKVFSAFADSTAKPGTVHHSSAGAFVGLLEAIVDRMADGLEGVGADLDAVSHRVFRSNATKTPTRRRPAAEDADLREILRNVGRAGDLTSKVRDSLLGFGRMVPYVLSLGGEWLPAEIKPRPRDGPAGYRLAQ